MENFDRENTDECLEICQIPQQLQLPVSHMYVHWSKLVSTCEQVSTEVNETHNFTNRLEVCTIRHKILMGENIDELETLSYTCRFHVHQEQ